VTQKLDIRSAAAIAFGVAMLVVASEGAQAAGRCDVHDELRRPLFGDFHVHTGFSFDAYTMDQRTTPDDAYRFARGEAIRIPPLDANGAMTREIRIDRPLDFAAVTDHAEFFGELALCTRPGNEVYDSVYCRGYRGIGEDGKPLVGIMSRSAALYGRTVEQHMKMETQGHPATICADKGLRCEAAARGVWQETQAAAERWNDTTSACRFTTFKAYEYSLTPRLTKIHRNVIFANDVVPATPISAADEPDAHRMREQLARECLDAGTGCRAVAIPHNSNLSNGHMFALDDPNELSREERAQRAELRTRVERLVEVMQIKGDSECKRGMWKVAGDEDELCDFEKFRLGDPPDCEDATGEGALAGRGCQSRADFVRYALGLGLAERERIGVNPFKFGLIGSTDTHNGNPGDVEESSFPGAAGARDATPEGRLAGVKMELAISQVASNPGGLVGVWAEENSRESIFAALERRETFGTSGPRMSARMFGAWSDAKGSGGFGQGACDEAQPAAAGYAKGVAMGQDLPPRPDESAAPSFLVQAARDPGTAAKPGTKLERLQIVKVWPGADGVLNQRIVDVAGGPSGATVDPATCAVAGPGHDALCSVWRDPEFDPAQGAVYYARAVENPSCRYSTYECNALPASERPESCSDPAVAKSIQERAWTSPIWYEPPLAP